MHLKRKTDRGSLLILPALCLLMLLASCTETPFYDKAYAFKDRTWNQKVKPKFEFEITDTSQFYDLVISVRTTTDYMYNNMWLFLETKTPSGLSAREPFQIRIADPKGEWLGTKTGTTIQNELIFAKRKFPEAGKYIWNLEQGITENNLTEILDIGIQIREYKSED